jgi:L-histidine N-alpha-methyltransferase
MSTHPGTAAGVTLSVHLTPADLRSALESDVRAGLANHPPTLPPKYFYDAVGSELYEEITRLPEYYPFRRERQILQERAGEIASLTAADTLVELGSGSSEKTRLLLDALRASGHLTHYVPVDVSETALRAASEAVAGEYPGLDVHGVVADFDRHLGLLPEAGHRLVAFLGGTIGNLDPDQRHSFLTDLRSGLQPGEFFLVGCDLVKDTGRLERAYDDSAGVTARFNRNVLSVLNRELDGDIDVDTFEHVACWSAENEWIEMRLQTDKPQEWHLRALGLTTSFEAGDHIRTEISSKFRQAGMEGELMKAGYTPVAWWTDPDGDFAVSLSRAE